MPNDKVCTTTLSAKASRSQHDASGPRGLNRRNMAHGLACHDEGTHARNSDNCPWPAGRLTRGWTHGISAWTRHGTTGSCAARGGEDYHRGSIADQGSWQTVYLPLPWNASDKKLRKNLYRFCFLNIGGLFSRNVTRETFLQGNPPHEISIPFQTVLIVQNRAFASASPPPGPIFRGPGSVGHGPRCNSRARDPGPAATVHGSLDARHGPRTGYPRLVHWPWRDRAPWAAYRVHSAMHCVGGSIGHGTWPSTESSGRAHIKPGRRAHAVHAVRILIRHDRSIWLSYYPGQKKARRPAGL